MSPRADVLTINTLTSPYQSAAASLLQPEHPQQLLPSCSGGQLDILSSYRGRSQPVFAPGQSAGQAEKSSYGLWNRRSPPEELQKPPQYASVRNRDRK